MFLLRVALLLCVLINTVLGDIVAIKSLVKRIRKEADVSTICIFQEEPHRFSATSIRHFDIPVITLTSAPKQINSNIDSGKNILLLPNLTHSYEENQLKELEKLVNILTVRNFYAIVVESDFNHLRGYLAWLSERKFTFVFGIVRNRIYSYFPYSIRKLQLISNDGHLPQTMQNLNGFIFRTNIQMDVPRTFTYIDKLGKRKIGGYTAKMFFAFIRKHNATYTEVPLNSSLSYDMPKVIDATMRDEIDLSMNPYVYLPSYKQCYPFKMVRWTLLIPHNAHVNPNEYFTRPFSTNVWISILATMIYMTVLHMIMCFCLSLKVDFWQSLSRIFCLFLNIPTERKIAQMYRFYTQVLIVTFILFNYYFIHLTSFLTVFIKAKQAYTIQDVVDRKMQLLMIDTEVHLVPFENLPRGFNNNIHWVSANELNQQRFPMQNKSFAYSAPHDKAEYILRQQVNLKYPNFHTSTDIISTTSFGFILGKNSRFLDILSTFVLEVLEGGLLGKWEKDAVYEGRVSGLQRLIKRPPDTSIALTVRHLTFAWNCLRIGFAGACLTFVVELILKWRLKCTQK